MRETCIPLGDFPHKRHRQPSWHKEMVRLRLSLAALRFGPSVLSRHGVRIPAVLLQTIVSERHATPGTVRCQAFPTSRHSPRDFRASRQRFPRSACGTSTCVTARSRHRSASPGTPWHMTPRRRPWTSHTSANDTWRRGGHFPRRPRFPVQQAPLAPCEILHASDGAQASGALCRYSTVPPVSHGIQRCASQQAALPIRYWQRMGPHT